MAQGEIHPDGTYVLQTDGAPGATPGWHRVSVVAFGESEAPDGLRRSLLPARYRDPEQSGLHFEIKPGQDNEINLNLE